ncbi:DUF262 domain-containing protein [Shewanella psychropiezotolerans]|uniref:DUF262 domain-containing protein n=1 Tax=Shewanella psychropiezotolerans TaxID=2593655 RepID=A0ABX5WTP5_9GAMM|nr:DUF262 domain-containing protein [Shewanella psychropiezotolerans]QDO82463.1 DUF262 domain-containing protein [Shewanella psychropiezotolerans]
MSVKQTLWQLLDNYNIEIPIIQRDYAQGRTDAKVTQIRIDFVQNLHAMVSNSGLSQDLDFIYGSVKNDTLVLLDGQQRLTTLFLLHWYVAAGTGAMSEARNKLMKFRYETRVSSREFVESLLDFSEGLVVAGTDEDLSKKIIDAHWFFSVWRNDPTVQSMLTMLDEIHRVFRCNLLEGRGLWEKLVCNDRPPVTFHFLNMQEFSLTDELYIKMNARGRPLTEFENFKAWLQSYVDKSDDIKISDSFWSSMDKEWTDVFWRLRDKGEYEVDDLFLRCFKSIALINVAKTLNTSSKQLDLKDDQLVAAFRDNTYVPTQVYNDNKCFIEGTLNALSVLLSLLHQLQASVTGTIGAELWGQCKGVFEGVLRDKGYLEQARFCALFVYVSGIKKTGPWNEDELLELADWLGVALRMINNTAFDISVNYVRAVHALVGMMDLIGGVVMNNLAEIEAKDIRYFNETQRDEEILKARLVVGDPSWRSLLRSYESHEYFYGQIGFLLEGSRSTDSDNYCQSKFVSLANKASVLFSNSLIETEDFLLQRALLSIGDYLIPSGSNFSFCKNTKVSARYRYENWRRVFNDKERRTVLFQLLGYLEEGKEKEGLELVIANASCPDWRQLFIQFPQAISYCKQRQIRFDNDEHDEIYLLNGLRMSGRHKGLRTFVLYQEVKGSDCSDIVALKEIMQSYYEVSGEGEVPGVLFTPWQGGVLQVDYIEEDFLLSLYDLDNKEQELQIKECKQIDALKLLISKIRAMEATED